MARGTSGYRNPAGSTAPTLIIHGHVRLLDHLGVSVRRGLWGEAGVVECPRVLGRVHSARIRPHRPTARPNQMIMNTDTAMNDQGRCTPTSVRLQPLGTLRVGTPRPWYRQARWTRRNRAATARRMSTIAGGRIKPMRPWFARPASYLMRTSWTPTITQGRGSQHLRSGSGRSLELSSGQNSDVGWTLSLIHI